MNRVINEVIFDVETKKWFDEINSDNPADLGVSIVSLYSRTLDDNMQEVEGKILSFWENEFDKMWPIFQNAKRIIGFNTLHFDVPALSPYAPVYFSKLPHFDIMAELKKVFGRRISLNAIAKETLLNHKIDSGENAVIYWNKGDKESLAKLKKYCKADVLLTRDIYDHVLAHKSLKFKDKWNNLQEVALDFSYPSEKEEPQIGLF
jgi:DEAD/DEAH box helicase domain-containing protein